MNNPINNKKFQDPNYTLNGDVRATVSFKNSKHYGSILALNVILSVKIAT